MVVVTPARLCVVFRLEERRVRWALHRRSAWFPAPIQTLARPFVMWGDVFACIEPEDERGRFEEVRGAP